MPDPFDLAAGWIQEHLLLPLMYQLGWMQWEDLSYGWALAAVYGAVQVALTFAICMPLERWRPLEHWPDSKAVIVDMIYTVISRVGILPLVTFVLFYQVQVSINGFLADHDLVPPTLERIFPFLLGQQVATFFAYALILDLSDYWRHRLAHQFGWWYALHSLHHAQRQMTFWSDDRNHVLDDLIAAVWFGVVALLIGVPPMQFPLLVLVLRFVESLSHANVRLPFGAIGERLVISPRFHRLHHGIFAAGERSCNYGAVFPWWDMMFGTADFGRMAVETGDPGAPEAMVSGGYFAQQWAGLRHLGRALTRGRRRRLAAAASGGAGAAPR